MNKIRKSLLIPLFMVYLLAISQVFVYAKITLSASHGDNVTTTYGYAKYVCGTVGEDSSGNLYVFMLGVASLGAGNFVAIDSTGTTAVAAIRLTETEAAKGRSIAVAKSAPDATQYGWFQIYGKATAVSTYANSKNAEHLATATAGYIAPLDWGGTTPIHGIDFADAVSGSGTAFLIYPHTGN